MHIIAIILYVIALFIDPDLNWLDWGQDDEE